MAIRAGLSPVTALALGLCCAIPQAIKVSRPDPDELLRFSKVSTASTSATLSAERFCSQRNDISRDGATPDEYTVASKDCAPCWLAKPSAPRLYITESFEGFGARLTCIIYGMALAAYHGMNFGGVLSRKGGVSCFSGEATSHGVNLFKAMSFVLGLKNSEDLFTLGLPKISMTFHGIQELAGNATELHRGGGNFFLFPKTSNLANDLDGYAHKYSQGNLTKISEYLTPEFLRTLRRPGTPISGYPLRHFTDPSRRSVAMHVRRGDVFLERGDSHGTPDEWYYGIVEKIRTFVPDAEVHVYSTLEGKHSESEFDGYRERDMTVHLDGDIEEDLAHLAGADILVTAKSSFSQISALLNPNCVIYQHWWLRSLEGMIDAVDGADAPAKWKPFFEDEPFQECLRRLERRDRPTGLS